MNRLGIFLLLFVIMISSVKALDINCSQTGNIHERFFPLRLVWNMSQNVSYDVHIGDSAFINASSPISINFSTENKTILLSSKWLLFNSSTNVTESFSSNCSGWEKGIKNNPPPIATGISFILSGSSVNLTFIQGSDSDGESILNLLNGSINISNISSGVVFTLPSFGNYSFNILSRDVLSTNVSGLYYVNYVSQAPIITDLSGQVDAFPFSGKTITLTYYLTINSILSVSASMNTRTCDLQSQSFNNYNFKCYFDITQDMHGPATFIVVATNSFSQSSRTFNILKVGKLTAIEKVDPVFQFDNIFNDWVATSQSIIVRNVGAVSFIGEDFSIRQNITCNNIVFNVSNIFLSKTANRGSSESGDYIVYDEIIDKSHENDYYMFLYNPGRITPVNCRSNLALNVISEVG